MIAHTLVYRRGSHLTATYVESLTPMLHRALRSIGMAKTPLGRSDCSVSGMASEPDVRGWWEQLGLPGLFDVHVHFLPPRLQAKV